MYLQRGNILGLMLLNWYVTQYIVIIQLICRKPMLYQLQRLLNVKMHLESLSSQGQTINFRIVFRRAAGFGDFMPLMYKRGGADKSLARQGRKQATATKLGIYSTYSQRSSMLLKSRASPDMLPFSLCNKKRLAIRHMNRPLFPTTLSIPPYDIGK